jgi:hypothetical protein
MKINAAARLKTTADTYKDAITVSFTVRGEAKSRIPDLLWLLHCLGSMGCSRGITAEGPDDQKINFYFDGDGADKIDDIVVDGKPYEPKDE